MAGQYLESGAAQPVRLTRVRAAHAGKQIREKSPKVVCHGETAGCTEHAFREPPGQDTGSLRTCLDASFASYGVSPTMTVRDAARPNLRNAIPTRRGSGLP
jgi:hypothetical protein